MSTTNKICEISVVICTRNRAKQLAQVLESACKMRIPEALDWEFLVIDNGSSDGTSDVVQRFSDRLPIRCIREDKAGLSNARNKGVAEAKGDYICWTDDDVLIDEGWLEAYYQAFKQHPEASVFGGKVIPYLEGSPPEWFTQHMLEAPIVNLLAYRDFGHEPIELAFKGGKTPYGANFALKTSEQKKYAYNPLLGVSPLHKRVGEETDVIQKIMRSGHKGYWVPGSKVTHIIPAKRQTYRYVFDYAFLNGETMAYLRDSLPDDNHMLAVGWFPAEYEFSKFKLYKRALNRAFKVLTAHLSNNVPAKLTYLNDLGFLLGAASYKRYH